ncbi:MAG TPA: prolyl oligopeptidase family serine peptidase [Thermoanaerobaculia bacterium]|nr:prolyl oligopeptidase family serine peptidase [Thermoanaerobaculia bacterium]
MHLRTFAAVMTALLITAAAVGAPIEYPKTKKVEQVDDYHGTKVADPYRWLETDVRTSKDVADWVAAENKITFDYLGTIPEREPIRKQLTTLWNYEKYSTPYKRGGHYFFSKNNGLQNQSVVYTVDKWGDTPRVLLDPNGWSKDGTVALGGVAVSDDAKYVAYAVAEAGSDWQTIRVAEVANGKQLADELKWVKFSGISWTNDDKGFFYSRFPAVDAEKSFQSLNRNQKVYYHRLGTPQSDDAVVYYDPAQPEWNHGADVSEDGRYLIITTTQGTANRNQVHVRDLQDPYAMPVTVVDKIENDYTFVGNDGPVLYFRTDLNAQKGRLIAIDLRNPARVNWKEILPESDATLQGVDYTGHRFVATYLRDAHSEIRLFDTAGKLVRTVELDGIGSAGGFGGRSDDTETFYSFSSYATPPSVYRYDLATGEKQLVFRAKVAMNPADYEVKQVFYTSKDGTKVPMFISYKKGLKLDGNNPTLLYGYGGFDISMTPGFSISRLTWMNMGGVYAVANLRGGGEYGEAWHDAGTKLHKQNVFDDFIAAAEYLTKNGYTKPSRLAVQGASNGGLLIGAVETQRPDLFGATLPAVGVMDMLRFNQFTAGRYWVDDYGSSANADEFKALFAYSPYHNIKPGTKYPATFITTADTDDRVVPGHSFKFAAAIQEAQSGPAPVLIRIETRAGHGGGKPTAKQIEETTDEMAFLVKNLGMKLPKAF